MALYAFDGTGDKELDGHGGNSNVLGFFRAYDGGPRNDDPSIKVGSLYLKGIGARSRAFLGDNPAEAFGIGGHRRVRQAIDRLENNLEVGDTVVDIIGFSRGAALAVSFANELAGKLPRVSIRFMGLNQRGAAAYLISLYCSSAVLTEDGLGVLQGVEVDHYHDYK